MKGFYYVGHRIFFDQEIIACYCTCGMYVSRNKEIEVEATPLTTTPGSQGVLILILMCLNYVVLKSQCPKKE